MSGLSFESYFTEQYLLETPDVDWWIKNATNSLPRSQKYPETMRPRHFHLGSLEAHRKYFINYLNNKSEQKPEILINDIKYHVEPTEIVNDKNIDKFSNLVMSIKNLNPSTVKHVLEHDGLFILTEVPDVSASAT
jgi:hypothetical protein